MEEKVNYWNRNHLWETELELLKDIISKTELVETTKWGGIVYTFNKRNVIGLGGFKDYFTIWFYNGVFLKDEQKLLMNAQEGVTKNLRQWRFTFKDEINEKLILAYIAEAIENEKQGKISKPQKKEPIVSTFFENELELNPDLKLAFQKFTPYKQKEFIEYIETAKQEKTKLARMEKIKPMILENIGLNDGYRKKIKIAIFENNFRYNMTLTETTTELELYFQKFRKNIIGIDQEFDSPFGKQKIIYTDWTASGRLYRPIEEKLMNEFGAFVANTHTETTVSGTAMTMAYHEAKHIIKHHVNANDDDVLINTGTGMTGVVNKFQRILGLKLPENMREFINLPKELKPIVFISHMEHHSNQTSWLETIADVEVIPANENGLFCLEEFKKVLEKYKDRSFKIASITSCSNVTGIRTPYHEVAKIMHQNNGVCFVDFACSGPYVNIDMHPEDKESYLDAIFFSPHKFLGGPGTSGVLVFNKNLYKNNVPDCPGGGTVSWTNPWGEHKYIDNIEDREDGGTPGFLQVIKTALAIQLKEEMGVNNILAREHEIVDYVFEQLGNVEGLNILANEHQDRLGVISFYIDNLHYNLGVKMLNDKFGIQTRGGCSCAGTYGHYLLHVDQETSHDLVCQIASGDLIRKPGWIRMSIHPTTTSSEIKFVCDSIKSLAENHKTWESEYNYNPANNEFTHKDATNYEKELVSNWFRK